MRSGVDWSRHRTSLFVPIAVSPLRSKPRFASHNQNAASSAATCLSIRRLREHRLEWWLRHISLLRDWGLPLRLQVESIISITYKIVLHL
jgi:hypothetical protein